MREFDERLDGLYFVVNPLCNLGFLYIFLVYFRLILLFCWYTDEKWRSERFLGAKSAYFSKLKIVGQQVGIVVPAKGTVAPIIFQEYRISVSQCWKAEVAVLVIGFL